MAKLNAKQKRYSMIRCLIYLSISAVIVVGMVISTVFSSTSNTKIEEARAKKQELTLIKKAKEEELKNLDNKEYLIRIGREKHTYSKEDEFVVKIQNSGD